MNISKIDILVLSIGIFSVEYIPLNEVDNLAGGEPFSCILIQYL